MPKERAAVGAEAHTAGSLLRCDLDGHDRGWEEDIPAGGALCPPCTMTRPGALQCPATPVSRNHSVPPAPLDQVKRDLRLGTWSDVGKDRIARRQGPLCDSERTQPDSGTRLHTLRKAVFRRYGAAGIAAMAGPATVRHPCGAVAHRRRCHLLSTLRF